MKKIYLTILGILYAALAYSQEVNINHFEKLLIEQHPYKLYKDAQGHDVGCKLNLECKGIDIVVYSTSLDLKKKTIHLTGRIYSLASRHDSVKGKYIDTLGIPSVRIQTAEPKRGKLKFKTAPVHSYSREDPPKKNIFPHRIGDFQVTFEFKENDRLYFIDSRFELVEYNIGKLLKNELNNTKQFSFSSSVIIKSMRSLANLSRHNT
jgi:hypothetical protein